MLTRRRLLVGAPTGMATLAAATRAHGPSTGSRPTRTRRFVMVIDLDKCVGCQACSVACKAEHGVRLGAFRSWVSTAERGEYPSVRRYHLPRLCNHCVNPACERVCPTGATWVRDDGIVMIDRDKCIGCRHCMGACPYNVRYFNPEHNAREEQFPAGTHGTVDKCDFCRHRLDNGVTPACVNTCPSGARMFGDANDPESAVHRLLAERDAVALLPQFGTGPCALYVGGDTSLFEGLGNDE